MSWHGYSDAQVKTVWHQQAWASRTVRMLKSVAECEDATVETRISALKMLNIFTIAKVLPEDLDMPAYMCWCMLAIAECEKLKRNERVQRLMEERLQACSALLDTMVQFVPQEGEGATVVDVGSN